MKNLCHLPRTSASFLLFGVFTILALAGCKQNGHTSDPRLRQIDEMLDSQLPSGTARSRVTFYLSSQNFPVEDTRDPTKSWPSFITWTRTRFSPPPHASRFILIPGTI